MQDKLSITYEQVKAPKNLALGYPVNREHSFPIDLKQIGTTENTYANLFMNNVGTPYATKSYRIDDIKDIELEVINSLFAHLGGDIEDSFGYTTSGGTEANFAAMWWHREFLINKFNQAPVLIASNKSHYSLDKIANQLQLKLIKLDSDSFIESLENTLHNINSPVILWTNIGSTVDGTIDDIQGAARILNKHMANRYRIHGDGAIYGIVIPYLEQFQSIKNIFNLIDTLSISGHKILGTLNICGIILCKKSYIEQVFDKQDKKIDYVRNAVDYTVSGSRAGLNIIELYLLLQQAFKVDEFGKSQLEKLWNDCLTNAKGFYSELKLFLGNNKLLHFNSYQLSIILPAPEDETQKFNISKKYSLMPVGNTQVGIYVLPRSTPEKLKLFLIDYKKCNKFYSE